MSITYEFEWSNVVNNTAYPFEHTPPFNTDVILDATICLKSRIYLRRFEFRPNSYDIYIARVSDNLEVGKAENLPYIKKDIEILNTITDSVLGYITIGEGISIYSDTLSSLLFTPEETTFEYCVNAHTDILQSINSITDQDVVFEEGFNFSIFQDSSGSLRLSPELGRGAGEFCGQPIFLDAIFNINGVTPTSDGNIEFTQLNQFLITPDPDNNTIFFGLSIPESRLNCERDGLLFKGSTGSTGATGATGFNGPSAPDSCIAFDSTPNGGCCECDSEEDFCVEGDVSELTPEEVLAELGIVASEGQIDPELLELLGIEINE